MIALTSGVEGFARILATADKTVYAGGGRALAVVNNPSDPTSWVAPTGFRKIVSTDNTDVANALGNGKATCYEHPVQLVLLEQSMRAAPGRAGTGAAASPTNPVMKNLNACATACTSNDQCDHIVYYHDTVTSTSSKCELFSGCTVFDGGTDGCLTEIDGYCLHEAANDGAPLPSDERQEIADGKVKTMIFEKKPSEQDALIKLLDSNSKLYRKLTALAWVENDVWDPILLSKATINARHDGVLYNGYLCQAFGSGSDGPVNPDGALNAHAGQPFRLPAGMEVASAAMTQLQYVYQEVVGGFRWSSYDLIVGRFDGTGYDRVNTPLAEAKWGSKYSAGTVYKEKEESDDGETNLVPVKDEDGKPTGEYQIYAKSNKGEWRVHPDGDIRVLACRKHGAMGV